MRVAVTGVSGFVGKWVVADLVGRGANVIACVRDAQAAHRITAATPMVTGDMRNTRAWDRAFEACHAVVHLAGRAHCSDKSPHKALAEHRAVNRDGTRMVAHTAARAGVRRFVFLSSIGVNGSSTTKGMSFRLDAKPCPCSPYAQSKFEAELALQEVAGGTGMEVVSVRPPMVYGPGAPGNLKVLTAALARRVPLPLGTIHNRRAFIAATNLADFISTCVVVPEAAGRALLVSDGVDISTSEFIRCLSTICGGRAPIVPFPPALLRILLESTAMGGIASRLLDDLMIDLSGTIDVTGWRPPQSMLDAMRGMFGETSASARAPQGKLT
jgi:nucleoside-diphosphate-sugar epimerase